MNTDSKLFTSKEVPLIYALNAKEYTGSIWDRSKSPYENGVKILVKKKQTKKPLLPQNPPTAKLRLFRK